VVEHKLGLLNKNRGAPYDDYPEMAWDKLMALNVKSIFYMTVGLESLLLKGTNNDMPSRVINISSMAGIGTGDVTTGDDGGLSAPGSGTFSYGPSKAACIHLSRMQSSKLAPKNIMVNCVCPGVFPSRMTNFGMNKCESVLRSRSTTLNMF
jgi:NAD(P)-dependent dehydrogenase (short-subunit alcohol dehydrogenase family)